MNNSYIYIYLDPRKPGKYKYGKYKFEYEPFYVGKGKNNQLYKHLKCAFKNNKFAGNNRLKYNKIKKIIREINSNPIIIKYFEFLSEGETFKLEKDLISSIGRIDLKTGPLTNLTDGGQGTSNRKVSKVVMNRMLSENNPALLKESIRLNKEYHSGLIMSEEVRNNMRNSWVDDPYRKKRQIETVSKLWVVVDPNGNKTKIKNLSKFCRENDLTASSMNKVASGINNHHKGWKCYRIKMVTSEDKLLKLQDYLKGDLNGKEKIGFKS